MLKVGKTFLANNTKVTLRFRFERSTFNWDLKSIEYENGGASVLLTPKNSVGAQMGLSYFTEGPIVFSNDSIVVTFKDTFQVSYLKLIIHIFMFFWYIIVNTKN